MSNLPQYYRNNLELTRIDKVTLHQTFEALSSAVRSGVKIIESGTTASDQYDGRGVYSGELGIAAAYLRLAQQAPLLAEIAISPSEFHSLASARIPVRGPDISLRIGGLSPLPSRSPIAAIVLRILHKSATGRLETVSDHDVRCLSDAVHLALSHGPTAFYHGHDLGADEVLFGRAGLLWALLNIRAATAGLPNAQKENFQPILYHLPKLIHSIVDAGRCGAAEYSKTHGDKDALPLMWPWKPGGYGVGWAHGLCGIIPVLLACNLDELTNDTDNYLPEIGGTISALCKICIEHNGHLPTKISLRSSSSSSSRESPLVQMCHGAPAILGLLGCAMNHTELVLKHWNPSWNHAARLATDRVWEEGLLSKGGGLCHGIAGNAWPLLLLHDAFQYKTKLLDQARQNYTKRVSNPDTTEYPLSGDYFLSRAIAMLLHTRATPPYDPSPAGASNNYRMPDHPYSLFEGLAGIVCALAEAGIVVKARLRELEVGSEHIDQDPVFRKLRQQQLGFPCLGGNGAPRVL
ncbi:hypothetical protein BDW75DRAFT_221600 [Aspergillus navahoensis]